MLQRKAVTSLGVLLLAFGLLFAACGTVEEEVPDASSGVHESDQDETVTSEQGRGQSEDSALRPFETVKGVIQIPERPQRVVTDYYGGELLAAGMNVIGVEPLTFNNPFLSDKLQNVENVGEPLNIEKILELEPDLIVVMYDKQYEELSKIAPTVHIPYNTATNIYETVELFGELAGDPDTAERFIADFEEKSRQAREQLEEFVDPDATVGIYELVNDGSLWIFGDNAGRGGQVFYEALGYVMPHLNKGVEQTMQLSLEVLPEYAADYMFLTVYDPDQTGEALRDLQESSIWNSLPAMKNNRVFINSFDTWYPYDPLAVVGQINLAVELLTQSSGQ